MVADRRRLAFAAFGSRPLDALDRIVGDRVLLAQIFEQRGERGQAVADRRAAEFAPAQLALLLNLLRARSIIAAIRYGEDHARPFPL